MIGDTLNTVFYRTNSLLTGDEDFLSIQPGSTVAEALILLRAHRLAQVPIISGQSLIGVFSYRSLAIGTAKLRSEAIRPELLTVDEFAEELPFANPTDDLRSVINSLCEAQAVLVGHPGQVTAILTASDALKYLYGVTSPFVLIREIELSLRRVISDAIPDAELADSFQAALRQQYASDLTKLPSQLLDLSFGQYVDVICNSRNWRYFEGLLGNNRILANTRLRPVTNIRNSILHFRRELTLDELEQLSDARDWLLKKLTARTDPSPSRPDHGV